MDDGTSRGPVHVSLDAGVGRPSRLVRQQRTRWTGKVFTVATVCRVVTGRAPTPPVRDPGHLRRGDANGPRPHGIPAWDRGPSGRPGGRCSGLQRGLAAGEDLVDDAVLLGHVGREDLVALDVGLDLLD